MRFKVFISSVQREFAAERQMLAEYVRKDALLGKFFDVFLFEEEPACDVEARDLYLPEVEKSDIYLGILGSQFGNADADGVSPTEREYDLATIKGKERLVFVKKCERDSREERFVQKVQSDVVRKSFETAQGLATPQYKPDSAIFHTIIWRKTEKVHQVGGVEAQSWPSQGQVEGTSQGQVVSLFVRITSILADQVLSSGDITAALGKEYYSGHLRRIIKMLLSDGIIEYTIPEKPRSRLQKYRLTEKGRQMLSAGSSAIGKR